MELYSTYQIAALISGLFAKDWSQLFVYSIGIGFFVWLALFILQGVGLYTMAKKREMKKAWLSFVPFVNIWYLGKLAGECYTFGHKVKRVGIFVMVAQIITTLLTVATVASEIYLYVNHGQPIIPEETFAKPYWPNLTGFSQRVESFYGYSDFFLSIFQLIFGILMLMIMTSLCKKYATKNYMPLSMLAFFVPLSRFVIIFCIRKNKAIDYEAHVRKQREEFMRRQQQYRKMYGNPYNPYSNPYGNPYQTQNPYNAGQTDEQKQPPKEEPFSEFFSQDSDKNNNAENEKAENVSPNNNDADDMDDLFS